MELTIWMHPLEACQSISFHVERCDIHALFFRRTVEFEELFDFEQPGERFFTIKYGNI